ncbi:hypothetical protein HLB23_25860 [Nocardia uniformis]|uniref:SH3 domain-containing protein n=1 Tax=Nocardia uniformis TaxID=53432 RepID=A0A849C3K9_9NOCA|nr:hypothetical protein [Nocardia uniformis]NNH73242.1 hypothetical protein [Nocardia uniformis]
MMKTRKRFAGITLSAAFLALSAGVVLAPIANADTTTTIAKDNVPIRTGPGASHSVASRKNKGDKFYIRCYVVNSHGNVWYKNVPGLAVGPYYVYDQNTNRNGTSGLDRC